MVGESSRQSKNSKAVREYKASGNKAMQNGAFQKAMRMYTKALELDPGNAILYSNRSASNFNTRQFSESLEDAESAILCDAMWWKAYKRKGLALIHMQRYKEAIHALEEGLKIVGKNAEMEKNLEFARACQEQAQNLYILPETNMMQRLESVPVFIVTDNVGQPFFVTYDDGQQVCTFYFDKEDAVATLDWIKSENPSLGDSARVIHITLHQAFMLAQETQKQYYEETTRAAAEEDRLASIESTKPAIHLLETKNNPLPKPDTDKEADNADLPVDDWEAPAGDTTVDDANAAVDDEETDKTPKEDNTDKKEDATTEGAETVAKELEGDDAIVDENAPLSFQFRPELRQVQIAVELLNKNPNPPVRPILRDPPSVRAAKSAAKAKAKADSDGKPKSEDDNAKNAEGQSAENEDKDETDGKAVGDTNEVATMDKSADEKKDDATTKGSDTEKVEQLESDKVAEKTDEVKDHAEDQETDPEDGNDTGDEDKEGHVSDDEDVELTVDNFNGIPIFQAKGLTLLQKNKQLIPLFFSKWDLEAAWAQLKSANALEVPGDCEIEVGTLEDVLRRMSECKTDEFESVFFVPSRDSMKAINVKFPLDELSTPKSTGVKQLAKVRKAGFSKAKQIAARGGTTDEIRAAIQEDLDKYMERKRIADVVNQIEHSRRVSAVGAIGGLSSLDSLGLGAGASSTSARRVGKKAGDPVQA